MGLGCTDGIKPDMLGLSLDSGHRRSEKTLTILVSEEKLQTEEDALLRKVPMGKFSYMNSRLVFL